MKLNKENKQILLDMGYMQEDIPQIERAIGKTAYFVSDYKEVRQKISKDKAIELLGISDFLSGIGRSAFHWSACREYKENCFVYFNSSRLFKED